MGVFSRVHRNVTAVLLLGAVGLLVFCVNHLFGASLMGDMVNRDLMHLWLGSKAVVMGLDPYDKQVWPTLCVRFGNTIFQEPACIYPMWTLALFVPMALLPFSWVVPLWMTASELALVGSIFLLLVVMRCQHERWIVFSAFIGSMLFRPFIASLTSGQMAPFLLFIVAVALTLYARGQSFWAGFLLGLLLIKFHLFVLFFPAVGLLFLARRDWCALGGLAASIALLLAISWFVSPWWPLRWIDVRAKTDLSFATPTLWGLAFDWIGPTYWPLAGILAVAVVSGVTLFLVVQHRADWLFGIGLALSGSLLVTIYAWNYDQLLLLAPAIVAFCCMRGRQPFRIMVWLGLTFAVPWGLFWIANLRGFDYLSALVTITIMMYLCLACWAERWAKEHEASAL